MPDPVQYGLLANGKLHEHTLTKVFQYCRLRILPLNELGYDEADGYSLKRSVLHTCISESLDLDTALVEEAFAKAAEKFHARIIDGVMVDGSIPNWEEDLTKIQDSFCDLLEEYAGRNEVERHPNRITKEALDSIGENLIMEMPNTTVEC